MNTSIRFPNLNIDFSFVGQSVSVHGFEITIYGLLITVGMLVGLLFMITLSKWQSENANLCLETIIPVLIGGVAGARLLYVILNWNLFVEKTAAEFWDIRNGGMSVYGGILGGMIFGAVFCRIRRISFSKMADIICMGFLPVQIIGIWGNCFNREAFGEYTDSLFAMQLPVDAVNSRRVTELMSSHLVEVDNISYIQVHPLFLYESLWCFLLFIVLLIYTRRKKYQGEIFLRYLAGYSLGRAGIEWLRPDGTMIPGTELPVFSFICVSLFVILEIVAVVRRSLSKKREKYTLRRNAERKKNAFNYDDVHSFEDVSHEFMEVISESEKSEEKEGSEDAEADQDPEGTDSGKDKSEEIEEKNTELSEKTERDDQQQDRYSKMSEDKPQA